INYVWPLSEFENGIYHLRIYGPNGFYREFAGDGTTDAPDILFQYEKNASGKLTGDILLRILNNSQKELTIDIVHHAYGSATQSKPVKAGSQISIPIRLDHSSNWYDFSVRLKGIDNFEKRYAGRVETGKAGISDPAMGNV
ncbi:MAG TPA: phospholipase domain-containing protein, partial [Puia sp.]|nr:phospholipase domain-containing protein [Puia sp.]